MTTKAKTTKKGQPMNVRAVKMIKHLKDEEGLSFRQAMGIMEKKLNKRLHVKTVWRWYTYELDQKNT